MTHDKNVVPTSSTLTARRQASKSAPDTTHGEPQPGGQISNFPVPLAQPRKLLDVPDEDLPCSRI